MKYKNYYPLRVDKKFGSAIVSDVDPERETYVFKDKQYEISTFGGHIIAESLPPGVAQQIVDAYNEKYAPKEVRVMDETLQTLMFIHKNNIDEGVRTGETIAEFRSRLHKSFSDVNFAIVDRFFSNEYNSGNSFTEGMDHEDFPKGKTGENVKRVTPRETPSAEQQMQNALNRGELPDYVTSTHYVDVVKVIEDLVMSLSEAINKHGNIDTRTAPEYWHNSLQNAEAALGMLQALKESKSPEEVNSKNLHSVHEDVLKLMRTPQITLVKKENNHHVDQYQLDLIEDGIYKRLSHINGGFAIRDAIMFALKEFKKL